MGAALALLAALFAGRAYVNTSHVKIQDALPAAQSAPSDGRSQQSAMPIPPKETIAPKALPENLEQTVEDQAAASIPGQASPAADVAENASVTADAPPLPSSGTLDTFVPYDTPSAGMNAGEAKPQPQPATGLARSVAALEDAIDSGKNSQAAYRLYMGVTSSASLDDLAAAATVARKEETKALIKKRMDRLREAKSLDNAFTDRGSVGKAPSPPQRAPDGGAQAAQIQAKPPEFAFVAGSRGRETVLRLKPGRGAWESFSDCPACPEMVVIPTGEFVMGARFAEGLSPSQSPAHRVLVRKEFAISKFEISNGDLKECVLAGGCGAWSSPMLAPRDWPATRLSFSVAKAYAAWLSIKTGKRYRLVSEAEWEYVARSGAGLPAGVRPSVERVNYSDFFLFPHLLRSVRHFPPNAWGVVNMRGNAMTWTEDCWHATYDRSPPDTVPWLDGQGGDCRYRSIRGGNIGERPGAVAETGRARELGDVKAPLLGLRIARDLSPPEASAGAQ